MSRMVGADLEQMRALAASFERAAAQLNQTSQRVRNGIQISAWVGPFAVRFRRTWDSEHSVKLRQAATSLSAQARQLRLEADQQDRASAASSAMRYTSDRVSDRDLVDFAESGTSDKSGISKHGYTMLSDAELRELGIYPGLLREGLSGFDAKVYRDGLGRIIVAFGGTEMTTAADTINDVVGAGATTPSAQGAMAIALAKTLVTKFGAENVVFTGQSLGGRNAGIASIATGARAVTFNAAGVGAADYAIASAANGHVVTPLEYVAGLTELPHPVTGQQLGRSAPHVTNYSTHNDPLSAAQKGTRLPDAVGEQHVVTSERPWTEAHDDYDALRRGVPD